MVAHQPACLPPYPEDAEHWRRLYAGPKAKAACSVILGALWAALSIWIALPWIADVAAIISWPVAIAAIGGIAIVPGYLNVQLAISVLLDRPSELTMPRLLPNLTVLTAAHNEEADIQQTLESLAAQFYPGRLRFLIIDDGSTDDTARIVAEFCRKKPSFELICLPHNFGKATALNHGLAQVRTELIATVDADTSLHPDAVCRAACRMQQEGAVACAGSLLVRDPDANFASRLQQWDYLIGIAAVKRAQAMLRGTLVAQGAFSTYDTEAVREAGGWPDLVGEDIVLTWAMLRAGGLVTWEATAYGSTGVPGTVRALARQRQRWARGMIEGLRVHGPGMIATRRLMTHGVLVNYLFPFVDAAYALVFMPGVILALSLQLWLIAGLRTLLVLPLTALVAGLLYSRSRQSMRQMNLPLPNQLLNLVLYLLLFQFLMAPVSVTGYVKELIGSERRW
jgi:biofilm PGA synthesis N-glycosyltransferase PgaC